MTVEACTAAVKACTVCMRELPLKAFHRAAAGRLGRESQCIQCRKAQEQRRNNREEVKRRRAAWQRAYWRAHPKARQRQYIRKTARKFYRGSDPLWRRAAEQFAATKKVVRHVMHGV